MGFLDLDCGPVLLTQAALTRAQQEHLRQELDTICFFIWGCEA